MAQRIEFTRFGGPEVLTLVEFDLPDPAEGEVLVRNTALGVNPYDWKFIAGQTGPVKRPFPLVPGNEGSGVVEAVGAGVTTVAVGDEVIWRGYLGGYATHRVIAASSVYAKPDNISFSEAAALPVAGGTAFSALAQLDVNASDLLLVHAAAGGVGSAAVQIAVQRDAGVIGTASAANHEYLESLGAIAVAYGDGLADRVRGVGAITASVDFVGSAESVAVTLELLGDSPRAVTAAHTAATDAAGIPAVDKNDDAIGAAIELAADGKLVTEVSREFPLADAAYALALSQNGHVRGKIVLLT